jgi:GNAT superfamily N-acetyltransferase
MRMTRSILACVAPGRHDRVVIEFRDATPEDAMAVAVVHVRAWKAAYRGLLPDEFLDALTPEQRATHYTFGSSDPADPRTMLAIADGAVAGFATTCPSRDEDLPEAGELGALYIDPSLQGGGVGRELLCRARERLVDEGFTEALLWVLRGNENAERFYRADGWARDGAEREEDPWGVVSTVIRYRHSLRRAGAPGSSACAVPAHRETPR